VTSAHARPARAASIHAVGGIPLARLAERVGGTPFFAYERAALTARVAKLRTVLPVGLDLGYAVKANPMPAVVQHLSGLVDSLDVASAGEMRVALDTATPPDRVSFAGPGKTSTELTQATAAGVLIQLESETEARRVMAIGDRLGVRPRVAVRVNPDFPVKGAGMRLGGGVQQFGVDSERVPALLRELAQADVDFLGFHIFAASQILDAVFLCEIQRKTVDLALRLARRAPMPVRYVNIGGGFGIPYFEHHQSLDLTPIADNLASLLDGAIRPAIPDARIVLELGRYIVGEAGVYVARVIDKKVSRGRTFLIVDGGLHHQLAASGNFGQVIRRNYPIAIAGRNGDEPVEIVSVVGCLCTPLDLLADRVALPAAEIGDLLVIFQAGAYGLTSSPTAFLSHPPPVEVMV
jgi:diaminopimelate decarboxylase